MSDFDLLRLACRIICPDPESNRDDLLHQVEASREQWPEIIAIASKYMITPPLAWGLKEKGLVSTLPQDVGDYFDAALFLNKERNTDLLLQVEQLAECFNKAGVKPVLLKGPASLITGLYPDVGQRMIGDIDLLASPEEIDTVIAVLKDDGYGFLENYEPDTIHYPLMQKEGRRFLLEVHFRLSFDKYQDVISKEGMVEEREAITLGEARIYVPALRHRICHNILHGAAIHGLSDHLFVHQLCDFVLMRVKYGDSQDYRLVAERFHDSGYGYILNYYEHLLSELFWDGKKTFSHPGWSSRLSLPIFRLLVNHQAFRTLGIFFDIARLYFAKLTDNARTRRIFLGKLLKWNHYKRFIEGIRSFLSMRG